MILTDREGSCDYPCSSCSALMNNAIHWVPPGMFCNSNVRFLYVIAFAHVWLGHVIYVIYDIVAISEALLFTLIEIGEN